MLLRSLRSPGRLKSDRTMALEPFKLDPFGYLPVELNCSILGHLSATNLLFAIRASRALSAVAASTVSLQEKLFHAPKKGAPPVWAFRVHAQVVERIEPASPLYLRTPNDWSAKIFTPNPILFQRPSNPENLFFRLFDIHQPELRLSAHELSMLSKRGEGTPMPFTMSGMYLTQPPATSVKIRVIHAEATLRAWKITRAAGVRLADVMDLIASSPLPRTALPGLVMSIDKAACLSEMSQEGMDCVGATKPARIRLCPTPSPPPTSLDAQVERLRLELKQAQFDDCLPALPKLPAPSARFLFSFYPPPTMLHTNVTGSCVPQ